MTAKLRALTVEDLRSGYHNPDFLGFGYLGSRVAALQAMETGEWPATTRASVDAADAAALAVANAKGWSAEDLFAWANSKNGRWYADATIGSDDDVVAAARMLVK